MASIIPTLLITPTRGVICLYNVEDDILHISNKFEWVEMVDEGCQLVDSGLMLLWMVVNIR